MGAVACLAACSGGPVEIDSPDLGGREAQACQAFLDDLPATVGGEAPAESSGKYGAAFGDPPIVVVCGVDRPDHLMTNCTSVDGVDWYVEEGDDLIEATTVGRTPNVKIEVPAEYDMSATTQIDLAQPIKKHLPAAHGC